MFIKLDIGINPIKVEDDKLYVLASRGCLNFCQSLDRKRFYLLCTIPYQLNFHFVKEGTSPSKSLLIRYLCKAGSPRGTAHGEIVYPLPVDAIDAGREKWFSLQTGDAVPAGDLVIKSDRNGTITYLMANMERRALAIWERNPGRIADLEAALDYVFGIDRNVAKMKKKRPRWGTSPKEIARRAKIADAEELAEARAYESALAEIDQV